MKMKKNVHCVKIKNVSHVKKILIHVSHVKNLICSFLKINYKMEIVKNGYQMLELVF